MHEHRFHTSLNDMLMELIHCWQQRSIEIIKVESAFLITKKYCERIREACWLSDFAGEQEKMHFFKHVQPQFCGRLMYYSILYEALISLPDDKASAANYWENESRRMERFTQKNHAFIHYIDSGATDRDAAFFVRGDYLQPSFGHSKIFQCGPDDPTLDHSLTCALFAERSYHEYVQWRLNT